MKAIIGIGTFIGFCFCLFVACTLSVWPEEKTKLIVTVIKLFSAPIGLIVGALVAEKVANNSKLGRTVIAPLAVLGILIWVFLAAFPFLQASMDQARDVDESVRMTASGILDYIDLFLPASSFLFIGALSYFFR